MSDGGKQVPSKKKGAVTPKDESIKPIPTDQMPQDGTDPPEGDDIQLGYNGGETEFKI